MGLDLFEELLALTAALDEAGVPYALCGGLALAVHGVARATTDVDLMVLAEDAEGALTAVAAVGYRHPTPPMRFPDGMVLRRATRIADGERLTLDLILADGPLAEVFATREEHRLHGQRLAVVGRDGLITMKTWAGRPQDLADVARLRELDR